MNMEELAQEFVALANKPVLTKSEHAETKKLMVELKKAGMSNAEISKLSGSRWSFTTIKGYTTGIKSSEPSPWQDATSLLNDLISTGTSLDDVDAALTVDKDLKSRGIGFDDVVEVLLVADSESMDVAAIMQQIKQLKESGLSITNAVEALEFKKALEESGFSLESLPTLASLAQKYGNPAKVLEALDAYISLKEIHTQTAVAKKELEDVNAETTSIGQKLQETQDALAELAKPLEAYRKAVGLGFGEEELDGLAILADKFGGPKAVLQVLKGYMDYSEINSKVSQAQSELITLESEVNKLNTEYGHMATAVKICRTLISEYDFGLDAISAILAAAQKYGDPITVLKAVEAYSKMEVILQEIDKQQGIISANKKEIAQLDGRHEDALKKLASLNDLALKVGSEVGKVQAEMTASDVLKKLLMLINEPYAAEYSSHINTAILVALSLRNWVIKNETKFKNFNHIESGLEWLVRELGGLP